MGKGITEAAIAVQHRTILAGMTSRAIACARLSLARRKGRRARLKHLLKVKGQIRVKGQIKIQGQI